MYIFIIHKFSIASVALDFLNFFECCYEDYALHFYIHIVCKLNMYVHIYVYVLIVGIFETITKYILILVPFFKCSHASLKHCVMHIFKYV